MHIIGSGQTGTDTGSGRSPDARPERTVIPPGQQVRRHDDDGDTNQRDEDLDGLGFPEITGPAPEQSQEQDAEVDAGSDAVKNIIPGSMLDNVIRKGPLTL